MNKTYLPLLAAFVLSGCATQKVVIHPSAKNIPPSQTVTIKSVTATKEFKKAVIVGLYDVAKMQDIVQSTFGDAFFGAEPTQIIVPAGTYKVFVRCENMYEIPIVNIQFNGWSGKTYVVSCYRSESEPFARLEVSEESAHGV